MAKIDTPATANGAFRAMKDLERQRRAVSENITSIKQALIDYTRKAGPTLVYKLDDQPMMIEALRRVTTKLDLSSLAIALNVKVSDLNAPGVAKLVESGKLTADMFTKYQYDEETWTLRTRKAHKKEIEAFRNKL
jgi:hypothetical protein